MADTTVKLEETEHSPNVKEEISDNNSAETELVENEHQVKLEDREDHENTNTEESFASMSRDELLDVCKSSNTYIGNLETKLANLEAEIIAIKNADSYQKQRDPTYREKILLRRLSLKDQEVQDLAAQINELKAAQIPALATLKATLLDPAINIIIQKLKNELNSTKASLEETQNELNAWKFTPDSNTGKRLMAKCRLLHQENEELGKMISSGRVAKLEGELALQKSFSEEVKKSQLELDELLQDLDEDVEGMQGTIYYLQQELKKSKEKIADLEARNQEFCKTTEDLSPTREKDIIDGDSTIVEDDVKIKVEKTSDTKPNFNVDDESSNDSSCLILKVNPEEEYESMFNDEMSKSEDYQRDTKTKRNVSGDCSKEVPSKKQKRSSSTKKEIDEN